MTPQFRISGQQQPSRAAQVVAKPQTYLPHQRTSRYEHTSWQEFQGLHKLLPCASKTEESDSLRLMRCHASRTKASRASLAHLHLHRWPLSDKRRMYKMKRRRAPCSPLLLLQRSCEDSIPALNIALHRTSTLFCAFTVVNMEGLEVVPSAQPSTRGATCCFLL